MTQEPDEEEDDQSPRTLWGDVSGIADQMARIRRLSEQAVVGARADATPVNRLDDLRNDDLEQDIQLKKTYAKSALIGVGIQLAIADVGFGVYLASEHGHVPPRAIEFWLSATVIQVIGVLLVITRYLFPRRDT